MSGIDNRNRLGEELFTYQLTKKGTVIISYGGRDIKIVKGAEADRLVARIRGVEDNPTEIQLLLAKITGNFKRGNEKLGKKGRK